jgi:hypothetical protein
MTHEKALQTCYNHSCGTGEWNSTFFTFLMIIEGTTEKVLQFKVPFTTKTLVSLNKECYFEHYIEVQTVNNILIDIIFVTKIFF